MTAWLEQIAAELLDTTEELRQLLRTAKYDRTAAQHPKTDAARYSQRSVTLSENQARALLRGALPAPIAASKLKAAHVKLNHAVALLVAQLFALNQPGRPPDHAIAAALTLQTVLESWLAATRWKQATTRARTSWPLPITAIMRQPIGPEIEQSGNTPANLFGTIAGAAIAHELTHQNSSGAALAALYRRGTKGQAKQAALDLLDAASAEIVPFPMPAAAIPTKTRTLKVKAHA